MEYTSKNIIKIGDGNVLVTATVNALIFKQLREPGVVGSIVDMREYSQNVIDQHTIIFQSYAETQQLRQLLLASYENRTFKFKSLEFDLSNYSRKCVDCIIDQLSWIETFLPKAQII